MKLIMCVISYFYPTLFTIHNDKIVSNKGSEATQGGGVGREVRRRFKREVAYLYPRLIHVIGRK